MLSFIKYEQASEQIEIVADDQGIDDLILYLQSIKSQKDHMHLTIGSELVDYPLPADRKHIVSTIKQVRIEYSDSKNWQK